MTPTAEEKKAAADAIFADLAATGAQARGILAELHASMIEGLVGELVRAKLEEVENV